MASLNKVMVIGNLGKDPEMSFTPAGTGILKFSVATTDKWRDKQTGEQKEKTEWHKISVFGKLAENCARYLVKGSQAYVEGKLQTSQYEKDGITRYSTEIVAHTVQFLGGKGAQQNQGGYQNNQGFQQPGQFQQPEQFGNGMNQQGGGHPGNMANQVPPDDDIPF